MNRRDALQFLFSAPACYHTAGILAQSPPVPPGDRIAIVVGVDKPGRLPPLRAAGSGARSMAAWLKSEGYGTVNLFVDEHGPVSTNALFDAVDAAVQSNPSQLLIYFAGHGIVNNYTELWLLSGSPQNPNEAVSLVESVELARASRIRNVVIISDCCRTRASNVTAERIRGSLIFPSLQPPPSPICDVDQFLATGVGAPSYEVASEGAEAYTGVFTRAFMDAFINPSPEFISQVAGTAVVSNRMLRNYLQTEVPKRAEAASIRITQHPDVRLSSPDTTFIARARQAQPAAMVLPTPGPLAPSQTVPTTLPSLVRPSPTSSSTTVRPPTPGPTGGGIIASTVPSEIRTPIRVGEGTPTKQSLPTSPSVTMGPAVIVRGGDIAGPPKKAKPTLADIANFSLSERGFNASAATSHFSAEQLKLASKETGFEKARDKIVTSQKGPKQFQGSCGFTVYGQTLRSVTAGRGVGVRIQNISDPNSPSAQVEIELSASLPRLAATIALRFADGTGTVLPAIDRFLGSVVVDDESVSSVSFLHADASGRHESRLAEDHALVATSARYGTFRIDTSRENRESSALALANRIRVFKSLDPTLGLYAAYAYAEAGLIKDVNSVRTYMLNDLNGVDLFDVALLAGTLSGQPFNDPRRPLPHMPMLSQGWALLRVKRVSLHPSIVPVQDHVQQGLWTTLDARGMSIVERALRDGDIA